MSTFVLQRPEMARRHFAFVRQHSLLAFFVLTFALSWAGMLAAVLLSPGGLSTTPEQLQQSLALAIVGMLLGPLIAGLLTMRGVDRLLPLVLVPERQRTAIEWLASWCSTL